jgi:hypothetical protein
MCCNDLNVAALGDGDGFTIELQNVAADSDICPSYREPATTYVELLEKRVALARSWGLMAIQYVLNHLNEFVCSA